jgi:hypothetical protein
MSENSLSYCTCPKPPGSVTEVNFKNKVPYCCACKGAVVSPVPVIRGEMLLPTDEVKRVAEAIKACRGAMVSNRDDACIDMLLAKAAIAAMSPVRESVEEWVLIGDAPEAKSGKPFWAWIKDIDKNAKYSRSSWSLVCWSKKYKAWMFYSNTDYHGALLKDVGLKPTHYRPLPSAPLSEIEGGKSNG